MGTLHLIKLSDYGTELVFGRFKFLNKPEPLPIKTTSWAWKLLGMKVSAKRRNGNGVQGYSYYQGEMTQIRFSALIWQVRFFLFKSDRRQFHTLCIAGWTDMSIWNESDLEVYEDIFIIFIIIIMIQYEQHSETTMEDSYSSEYDNWRAGEIGDFGCYLGNWFMQNERSLSSVWDNHSKTHNCIILRTAVGHMGVVMNVNRKNKQIRSEWGIVQ